MSTAHFYRVCSSGRTRLPLRTKPARGFTTCPGCFAPLPKSRNSVDTLEPSLKEGSSKLQAAGSAFATNRTTRGGTPASRSSIELHGEHLAASPWRNETRWFSADSNSRRFYHTPNSSAHAGTAVLDRPNDRVLQPQPEEELLASEADAKLRRPKADRPTRNGSTAGHRKPARRSAVRKHGHVAWRPQEWLALSPSQQTKEKERQARYAQWGYLRHQYTGPEKKVAQNAFSQWVKMFDVVQEPSPTTTVHWRDHGEWLFELENTLMMRRAWGELPVQRQKEEWPLVMMSTLYSRPDKAAMVLDATLDPLPPGYAIHDVIMFVVKRLRLTRVNPFRERTAKADEIMELLAKILETLPSRHVSFQQRTWGMLARRLPSSHTRELYDVLKRSGQKLHAYTLLQFAGKLAGDVNHKGAAFEILKGLTEDGINLNIPNVASVITSLLHTREMSTSTADTFSAKDALQYFVEKGLTPNVISLTGFLDTLCRRGEVEEAIRLALLFAENGVGLDARACATIFAGAKASLKAYNVEQALDVARVSDVPYVDVLNNMLHSALCFAEMESREKKGDAPWTLPLFIPLLHIYSKKFELGPLQSCLPDILPLLLVRDSDAAAAKFADSERGQWDFHASILHLADKFFSEAGGPRLQPNSTTLAIMIRAYIKSLRSSYDLATFYSFFKSRLEDQPDQLTAKLIEDQRTIIHDTFILALVGRKGLSRAALQVFGDMMKGHLMLASSSDHGSRAVGEAHKTKAPVHPAPNIYTFSILLRGLLEQQDQILASQILQVMKEHGVEPNLVTWNILIKGHATVQNVEGTVEALQDLEAAGFNPDAFTFKAFGRLKNQERALEKMQGIIDSNAQELMSDLGHWTGRLNDSY